MSALTPLSLPPQAPFPVKISTVHVRSGQRISKHDQLVTYTYWEYQDAPVEEAEDAQNGELKPKKIRVDLVGTFESPIDGTVEEICVSKDDELLSADTPVVKVMEECTHAIQYGGLCALCGKNMDEETDYTGYKLEDRAPISMSHGTSNLKVSKDEAEKVEEKWQKGLVEQKKLILVVDLDQTVIHATVDPTIGEWMKDESNANYPSLKDVKQFDLEEKSYIPTAHKEAVAATYLRTYYVKLRPGLEGFLERVSEKYELHIYTMGTRTYAKAIAQCIDPEGKYFADRILSRDESGSMTQKSLERLFPTDTSMVVIIDDRGDVWNWSDHLVKVVPFDFFVGIGDINSNFLPKQKSLLGPTKRRESIAKLEEKFMEEEQKRESSKEAEDLEKKIEEIRGEAKAREAKDDEDVILSDEQNAELIAARSSEREVSLEAQKEERPLAKLQKNLDELAAHSERLLYDDDDELEGLEKALAHIHTHFYDKLTETPSDPPNIKDILPKLKKQIFAGIHLVFSGLLPLNTRIENESVVVWVRSFGATVDTDVTMETTHIIAKNPYTLKAKIGKSIVPGCKIMHPDWLFDSMTNWRLADTKKYEVEFAADQYLSEVEVKKHKEKMLKDQTRSQSPPVSLGPDTQEGGDLLGGDMDWLNEDDEDEEDFLSSDEEAEENGLKRSISGDDEDEDGTKRRRVEGEDDDDDDDDDEDDEFAAELMLDLEED